MQSEIVSVIIEGVAPLIQHNGASAVKGLKQRGRRIAGAGPDKPEEWKDFLYPIPGTNKLGHTLEAIYSALVTAAREFKADKRRTMKEVIKSCVFPKSEFGDYALLEGKTAPDYIDERTVVNPSTRGRNMRYRPAFAPGWRLGFDLEISDPETVPVDKLKEILDYAGLRVGIGEMRPRFGRFMVTQFERR